MIEQSNEAGTAYKFLITQVMLLIKGDFGGTQVGRKIKGMDAYSPIG